MDSHLFTSRCCVKYSIILKVVKHVPGLDGRRPQGNETEVVRTVRNLFMHIVTSTNIALLTAQCDQNVAHNNVKQCNAHSNVTNVAHSKVKRYIAQYFNEVQCSSHDVPCQHQSSYNDYDVSP